MFCTEKAVVTDGVRQGHQVVEKVVGSSDTDCIGPAIRFRRIVLGLARRMLGDFSHAYILK